MLFIFISLLQGIKLIHYGSVLDVEKRKRTTSILQVNVTLNSGSTGRIAEQIGRAAIQQGWDSYIAYARNHLPSQSKTIKIGNKFDIYWHCINTRLFDNHCLCSTSVTKRLIKQIEKIKPDIILLHNIHGYFLNMKVLFTYLATLNTPIVWVLHDCWPFTGHCAYFDYVRCEKWKSQCYGCPQKQKYPASFYLDRSSRNFALKKRLFNQVKNMTIVPVSQWLGSLVEQSFLKQYFVHIIQNGIDIDVFSPQKKTSVIREKYGINNKQMLLGVATTWSSRKGLVDYIKLSSLIDEQIIIVLVGLTKKQIKKLPHNIIGIERTENVQELALLYSAADILVNLSYEETFGLTIAEALACGTPAIVYNATACPEIISSETGIAVETENISAVLDATHIIQRNGKSFYSDNCRKRAVALYNKHDRFGEYMRLFNELLKNKNVMMSNS